MHAYQDQTQEVLAALTNDNSFAFKRTGSKYLTGGICPKCGKKEVFVSTDKPFIVKCNRENKCGWSEHTRELYPELSNNLEERFPKTKENPNATADAYIQRNRRFPFDKVKGWYSQELYQLPDKSRTVPTIRFYIDANKERYWERLIDVTKAQAKQRNNIAGKRKKLNKNDKDYNEFNGTLYKGEWWTPPGQSINKNDIVYLVEGIFHAIALHLSGYKVAATFSANNFPTLSIRPYLKKNIQWIMGFDDDKAGRKNMLKFYGKLITMGEWSGVALTGSKLDWDDLYRRHKINDRFIQDCRYRGRLFTAKSINDKAWEWHKHTRGFFIVMEFEGALFSVTVNHEFNTELSKETGEVDVHADGAEDIFKRHVKISQASNVAPTFLYCEIDQLSKEITYDFQIQFANGSNESQIGLTGSAVESPTAFNKALLANAPGATFTGNAKDFTYLVKQWFNKQVKTVESIGFVGYSKEHDAWIFPKFAYSKGQYIEVNEHAYFDINKHSVKTSFKGVQLDVSQDFDPSWLTTLYQAFSGNGLMVLTYWIGSLFAEQLRAKYKSWPFLEVAGQPGTGKTTILELLWRTIGRVDYEGIDPSKSSAAGRARAFMQVANMPIVLTESDRGNENGKNTSFDYDELKTAYNGRAVRTMGVYNRGAETEEPPFRGAIIFAQNAIIESSPAIMERIVLAHFKKEHTSAKTTLAVSKIERMTTDQVNGLLHRVLTLAPTILNGIDTFYEKAKSILENHQDISNNRIIKNHAQLMAVAMSLPDIFPNMNDNMLQAVLDHITQQAINRHKLLEADNPIVSKFWDLYELLNEPNTNGQPAMNESFAKQRLNHSKKPEHIAINLQQFYQVVSENRAETISTSDLKKQLPTSKRYKLIESNKVINSQITGKSLRCMIFMSRA